MMTKTTAIVAHAYESFIEAASPKRLLTPCGLFLRCLSLCFSISLQLLPAYGCPTMGTYYTHDTLCPHDRTNYIYTLRSPSSLRLRSEYQVTSPASAMSRPLAAKMRCTGR